MGGDFAPQATILGACLALKEIFLEVEGIKNGITQEELSFAKSSLIKRFPANFETYRQISGNIISKIIQVI